MGSRLRSFPGARRGKIVTEVTMKCDRCYNGPADKGVQFHRRIGAAMRPESQSPAGRTARRSRAMALALAALMVFPALAICVCRASAAVRSASTNMPCCPKSEAPSSRSVSASCCGLNQSASQPRGIESQFTNDPSTRARHLLAAAPAQLAPPAFLNPRVAEPVSLSQSPPQTPISQTCLLRI